jgi:glycosyltransferase involved in cell wall biosynthesis
MSDEITRKPTLLFVVNWDWFFLSHRLPIALAARARGYHVAVTAVDTGRSHAIRAAGIEFIPLNLDPHSTHPLAELRTVIDLARVYRRLRPDLVHHVTIKPVLYGSIVARGIAAIGVVNAISGLGQMFSGSAPNGLIGALIRGMYRLALRHPRSLTIFQNPEDLAQFVEAGIIPLDHARLIRGSGVDLQRFHPSDEPAGDPLVVMPARLLWEKGVAEFVEAARSVRARCPAVRMAIVGTPDPGNPGSVSERMLADWRREGVVEIWGHRDDMPAVMAGAHIVALPTHYKEGVPKALLEAASAGRAIVTTDVPGCREVVQHEVTGLLIPPKDSAALATAIVRLVENPRLRAQLGRAGRGLAEREFGVELVVNQTLALYTELRPLGGVEAADGSARPQAPHAGTGSAARGL